MRYNIVWYVLTFIVINCVWAAVVGLFVPGWLYNIGTVVLQVSISMVIFFFVIKIIFPEGESNKSK